ncbi:MAG: transcription antitermination factor NusB [Bryobacteraceae bacterium]|nr:transcription antitermination factor NusB [Bryobacteraceae bacterium]
MLGGVEEVGSMNVFFKIKGEVWTPALNGSILGGITRDSVIHLLRDWGIPIREEKLSMEELYEAFLRAAMTEADRLAAERSEPASVSAFARELVRGVQAHRRAIDAIIAKAAPQWPVEEVAVIDRNILRLATYEVLFDDKTPVRAVVNEAVELAKTFGSDSSPRFVNGVLGTVAARATR